MASPVPLSIRSEFIAWDEDGLDPSTWKTLLKQTKIPRGAKFSRCVRTNGNQWCRTAPLAGLRCKEIPALWFDILLQPRTACTATWRLFFSSTRQSTVYEIDQLVTKRKFHPYFHMKIGRVKFSCWASDVTNSNLQASWLVWSQGQVMAAVKSRTRWSGKKYF